jgi:hypothetical protein
MNVPVGNGFARRRAAMAVALSCAVASGCATSSHHPGSGGSSSHGSGGAGWRGSGSSSGHSSSSSGGGSGSASSHPSSGWGGGSPSGHPSPSSGDGGNAGRGAASSGSGDGASHPASSSGRAGASASLAPGRSSSGVGAHQPGPRRAPDGRPASPLDERIARLGFGQPAPVAGSPAGSRLTLLPRRNQPPWHHPRPPGPPAFAPPHDRGPLRPPSWEAIGLAPHRHAWLDLFRLDLAFADSPGCQPWAGDIGCDAYGGTFAYDFTGEPGQDDSSLDVGGAPPEPFDPGSAGDASPLVGGQGPEAPAVGQSNSSEGADSASSTATPRLTP